MDKFDIYFSGGIIEGQDPAEVKTRVGRLFKVSGAKLEQLFSGKPVRVKSAVDVKTAGNYREAFRKAGALLDIKPAGPASKLAPARPQADADSVARPAPEATAAAASTPELLPARTGSLIDCAPEIDAVSIPDISSYALSSPGTQLDDSVPPPQVDIDISDLEAAPANSGSLEDYTLEKEPVAIPDISQLTAAEPNSGTLEDCAVTKEPTAIPDISSLQLVDI